MGKIKHSRDFQLEQAADIIFPLFSAEGEKLWVPGWDYENTGQSTITKVLSYRIKAPPVFGGAILKISAFFWWH